MTGCPVPHTIGLNLCGVSVCYRVVMLKLLLALVISSLAVVQPLLAQTAARQETDQHGGRASADCGRRSRTKICRPSGCRVVCLTSKRVPSVRVRSGADLYGSANGSGGSRSGAWQSPHLRDQRSSRSKRSSLKLVALGTSQFPDGGPRRPVYSDKGWPQILGRRLPRRKQHTGDTPSIEFGVCSPPLQRSLSGLLQLAAIIP